jgi:hypothetical protein
MHESCDWVLKICRAFASQFPGAKIHWRASYYRKPLTIGETRSVWFNLVAAQVRSTGETTFADGCRCR